MSTNKKGDNGHIPNRDIGEIILLTPVPKAQAVIAKFALAVPEVSLSAPTIFFVGFHI